MEARLQHIGIHHEENLKRTELYMLIQAIKPRPVYQLDALSESAGRHFVCLPLYHLRCEPQSTCMEHGKQMCNA
jgi:hypothetical protein